MAQDLAGRRVGYRMGGWEEGHAMRIKNIEHSYEKRPAGSVPYETRPGRIPERSHTPPS
jgi:hypothetical protein